MADAEWGGARPRAGARKNNYNSLSAGTRSKRFAPFYKMLGKPYADEFKAIVQKIIDDAMAVAPDGRSPYARRMRQLCRLHALQRITIGMEQVRDDNAAEIEIGDLPLTRHQRAERFLNAFRPLQYTGYDSAPYLPPPEAGRDIPWHRYKQQVEQEITAQREHREIPSSDLLALSIQSRTVRPVTQRVRDQFNDRIIAEASRSMSPSAASSEPGPEVAAPSGGLPVADAPKAGSRGATPGRGSGGRSPQQGAGGRAKYSGVSGCAADTFHCRANAPGQRPGRTAASASAVRNSGNYG